VFGFRFAEFPALSTRTGIVVGAGVALTL
jgi:hypothetical protein